MYKNASHCCGTNPPAAPRIGGRRVSTNQSVELTEGVPVVHVAVYTMLAPGSSDHVIGTVGHIQGCMYTRPTGEHSYSSRRHPAGNHIQTVDRMQVFLFAFFGSGDCCIAANLAVCRVRRYSSTGRSTTSRVRTQSRAYCASFTPRVFPASLPSPLCVLGGYFDGGSFRFVLFWWYSSTTT